MKRMILSASAIAALVMFSNVSAQTEEATPTVLSSIGWYAGAGVYTNSTKASSSLNGDKATLETADLIDATTGILTVEMKLGEHDDMGTASDENDDSWPYVTLAAPLITYEGDNGETAVNHYLTNSAKVTITYKSDADVKVILPLRDGETSLTADNDYSTVLASSAGEEKTVDLMLDNTTFKQEADWGTIVDFDKSKMNVIEFAPTTEGSTVKLTISAISIDGLDEALPIRDIKSVDSARKLNGSIVTGISKKGLTLNVPATGAYTVSLLAANGRLIETKSAQLTANTAKEISMNNTTNGVYFVKIEGNGINMTEKVSLK